MQLNVRGKNLEVTESLRALVQDKLGKLDRYFGEVTEVEVELTYERTKSVQDRHHVDASLLSDGSLILRAEARGVDMRAALDNLVDVVQGRVVRHKERLQQRGKVSAAKLAAAQEASDLASIARPVPARGPGVDTQEIDGKPLTLDEALEELASMDREWLLFVNARSGLVNVLERRGGSYVLHTPPTR